MAKKQTFGDKLGKGPAAEVFPVKVLKWEEDENRGGNLRLKTELMKLKDQNEINNL